MFEIDSADSIWDSILFQLQQMQNDDITWFILEEKKGGIKKRFTGLYYNLFQKYIYLLFSPSGKMLMSKTTKPLWVFTYFLINQMSLSSVIIQYWLETGLMLIEMPLGVNSNLSLRISGAIFYKALLPSTHASCPLYILPIVTYVLINLVTVSHTHKHDHRKPCPKSTQWNDQMCQYVAPFVDSFDFVKLYCAEECCWVDLYGRPLAGL